jgi:pSer/pThr/pTyr-binding forkhead associated (FHA) protein
VDDTERVAYPVRKRTTSIGRDAASHVVVRDPTVSRFHVDVRAEAGEHVLYSMGSAGTTINGVRVSGPQLLEEGDEVALGGARFRYTREAVPSHIRVELGGGELDTVASVRPTLVMQEAVTAEMPIVRSRTRPPLPMLIGLVAVLLAMLVIFVL